LIAFFQSFALYAINIVPYSNNLPYSTVQYLTCKPILPLAYLLSVADFSLIFRVDVFDFFRKYVLFSFLC